MITYPNKEEIRAALISAGSVETLIKILFASIPSKPSGPYPVALLLDEEGGAFSHVISSGLDSEFVTVLKNARIADGTTSSAKAVQQNAHVYIMDVDKDQQDWEDMPCLSWGLLASWTASLRTSNGRAFGAVTLYFGMPKQPTSSEKESFEDFAACLASGIQSYLR